MDGGCPDDIDCTEAKSCTINCQSGRCQDIHCGSAACDITCGTGVSGGCGNITCGSGSCKVQCAGNNACSDVTCDQSCGCDVTGCDTSTCGNLNCPTHGGHCTTDGANGTPCDSTPFRGVATPVREGASHRQVVLDALDMSEKFPMTPAGYASDEGASEQAEGRRSDRE